MVQKRQYDLNKRLIKFCIQTNEVCESLDNSKLGKHLCGQLVRSCSSPALNYGEACAAESLNDFIHKLKIILKELRESGSALEIIIEKPLIEKVETAKNALKETNELVSIFVSSIKTCEQRKATQRKTSSNK